MMPLIPILNGLALFVAITLISLAVIKARLKNRELLSKEIIIAIENGADIPLPVPKERNYLNLGLIWSLVGIAFTIALWFSSNAIEGAVWGLLPFALGVAFLLIHKYQKNTEKE